MGKGAGTRCNRDALLLQKSFKKNIVSDLWMAGVDLKVIFDPRMNP